MLIDKAEVYQMLMWVDNWDGNVPVPAILVPTKDGMGNPEKGHYTPYWTGKQMMSLVIPRANILKKSKEAPDDEELQDLSPGDTRIMIKEGVILSGIMDKNILGTGGGGLVHVIWKENGPDAAKFFLNSVQKLVNYWLAGTSYTIGVGDTVGDPATLELVVKTLTDAKAAVQKLVRRGQLTQGYDDGVDKALEVQPGKTLEASFEQVNWLITMVVLPNTQVVYMEIGRT